MEEQKKNPAQGLSESEQVQVRRYGRLRSNSSTDHWRRDG